MKKVLYTVVLFYFFMPGQVHSQPGSADASFTGQMIGWTNLNLEEPVRNQWGLRYIPSFTAGIALNQTWRLDGMLSVNAWTSALIGKGKSETDYELKPYRLWLRLSTDQFEFRAGLQKINFGTATMIRPLMWFDRIDPRDPLQLTDGVYAALARYYFLNNANIWFWILYGNDDPKGWEYLPTSKHQPEYGGRIQWPLYTGETGISYHHRRIGPGTYDIPLVRSDYPELAEDRLGIDGKWDIGPGIWVEEVLKHRQQSAVLPDWENYLTIGMDYTFGIGNGLTASVEHFLLRSFDTFRGDKQKVSFTALHLTYPPGLMDMLSAIVYYRWEDPSLYRFLSWQRTYDKWSFYLMAYWNPETIPLYTNLEGNYLFAGKGLQLMFVFNH